MERKIKPVHRNKSLPEGTEEKKRRLHKPQLTDKVKRNVLLGVLAAALVGAGWINYSVNASRNAQQVQANVGTQTVETVSDGSGTSADTSGDAVQTVASASFFADFRSNRDSVRSQEVEYLDSIIQNANSDQESLQDAQLQKVSITQRMETELAVEELIKAKGFADAVITLREGSVNVVVDASTLEKDQVAQVLEIVKRETGEKAENIKVMARG